MKWFVLSLLVAYSIAAPVEEDTYADMEFDENFPEENPGLFEGDIELQPHHRNAIVGSYHYWPGGVIPYSVDSHYSRDSNSKHSFESAMKEIHDKTMVNGKSCITFVPRTTERSYIQFTYGSGCHTPVGILHNRRSDVTLGRGCLRHGTIIHEILHALGFWHEQSRADRDNFVTIDFSNIQSGHEGNFNKYVLGRQIDHLGLSYDYGSVMHYSAYAFAKDRSKPTIIPKQRGVTIGQRVRLSDQDAKEIQILYGCIPRPDSHAQTNAPTTHSHVTNAPHVTHAPVTPQPTIHHITASPHPVTNGATTCSFESGLCGWTQSHTDTLDWQLHHGNTPSAHTGPHADHTGSTTAHYLYLEASQHYNKVATLVSPNYNPDQYCWRVWYNMNGAHIGSLKFYFVHYGRRHLMRTISGNHDDIWHHNTFFVRIGGSTPFHFEIEGHTGNGYTSDIAIDDISVTPGSCSH